MKTSDAMSPGAEARLIAPGALAPGRMPRELWEYRELIYFLVWRDIKVRYKQTALGVTWAILQPLSTALIFTLFFSHLAGVSSGSTPYPLFSYAGMLAWTFFSQGLTQSSASLVGSANLLTKIYFPRLVIPISAVLAGGLDLLVATPILVAMMAYYKVWPGMSVLMIPLVLALLLAATLGLGTWFSALTVEYRDVRYALPFFIQLGLFVTPIIYPATKVTAWLSAHGLPAWLLAINPMTGVVEGFRWSALGEGAPPWSMLAVSSSVAVVVLVTGCLYFRRVERSFADVV